MSMTNRDIEDKLKYKVLLVAYKDISDEVHKELSHDFVSTVNEFEDLRDHHQGGDGKDSAGLMYRTSLYQKWFRDDIIKSLEEGYRLGIIEMRLEYFEKQEGILNKIIKENESKIKIVDTAKL